MLSQEAVKVIGKVLSIAGTEWCRPACLDTAAAEFIEHISNRQPLFDIVRRVKLAARVKRVPLILDRGCSQGNISSDDQVPGLEQLDDLVISNIKPGSYDHRFNIS